MKKWTQFFLFLIILSLTVGGNASSKETYEKDGVRFDYPSTWRVSDASDGSIFNIMVNDPDDGLIIITIKFSDDTEPLEDNFRRILRKMDVFEIEELITPKHTQTLKEMEIPKLMMFRYISGKKSSGLAAQMELYDVKFYNLVHKIWLGETSIFFRIHSPIEDWRQNRGGYLYVLSTFAYENP